MHRWNSFDEAAQALTASGVSGTVVTIGNFDGVHLGHQVVLHRLLDEARARDLPSIAITFDPHPREVLTPGSGPPQLMSLQHRLTRLAELGLSGVAVIPFTLELAAWTPEHFVKSALVDALRVRAVVVGPDTRFGHRNSGDVNTLRTLGTEWGFDVVVAEAIGEQRAYCSTLIRERLAAGDVEGAAEVLGNDHSIEGVVVHGDHRGRELGFPTANLEPQPTGMIPADGVYAGWVEVLEQPAGQEPAEQQQRLPAAISVGTNPTFEGTQRRVEAYVLDRTDLDLYGALIRVTFTARLRPTLRFDGADALVAQMQQDVAQAAAILRA